MGLLDMLGMGGPEGKVRRLQKKASAKFGPAENRQGAIEELGALKTDAAVEALLLRYTFRVDPGITDAEEKARGLALTTQGGDGARGPGERVRCGGGESRWSLALLRGLGSAARVVEVRVR